MKDDAHKITGLFRVAHGNHRACQLQFVLVSILLVLLSGCVSFKGYTGEDRQSKEIAIIETSFQQSFWFFGGSNLYFSSLDFYVMRLYTTEIQMEPGEHRVGFRYVIVIAGWGAASHKNYDGALNFTAQKGHRYQLDAEREDGELWAWIIDQASGEIVAGEQPP